MVSARWCLLAIWLVLYGCGVGSPLKASWKTGQVHLSWTKAATCELWRSTSGWDYRPDKVPACIVYAGSSNSVVDATAAPGTTYFYELRLQGSKYRIQFKTPRQPLAALSRPELRVDKEHYVLEVWDQGLLRKRYPIALGRDPKKRKLHFDNATTPEGNYRIVGLQPDATYYKAYDIDYPNADDLARYRRAGVSQPIGGEIQIHGMGIGSNWTFGCVAMRNEDIDELFSHPEIGMGTLVRIYGGELSWGAVAR